MIEQPVAIPIRKPFSVMEAFAPMMRVWYAMRSRYRHMRISKAATELLGPQYRRSRDRIEIDITYVCNLRCLNCNRSISQAPEKLHISLDTIRSFVQESIAANKRWKVIRVLGGEPTLHPEFQNIVSELLKYQEWEPACSVIVVSNGHGKAVSAALNRLPPQVQLENTAKTGNIQPGFGPFNFAPMDDPAFQTVEYRNGCDIMEECGMGLTPLGYYPCAVAGGIDRIAGKRLGYSSLPADEDDMLEVSNKLCRLCGHFRDGHCVPQNLRAPLLKQEMSVTWVKMYDNKKREKRLLRQGSSIGGLEEADQKLEKMCD